MQGDANWLAEGLVDNTIGPYQHSESSGANWRAMAEGCGCRSNAVVDRHQYRGKGSKARQAAADATANGRAKAAMAECCSCMGSLLVVHASVVKLMRWLDSTPAP